MSVRVVFMGSPEFALPSLRILTSKRGSKSALFEIAGVVSQPDKPSGRGRKIHAPPVKSLAVQLDLPIIQPENLRQPGTIQKIKEWSPELIIVAAFGQILKPDLLELPQHGCINVHASLLPRWRGAAPINAAILHGDEETGVTIMKMDAGLDTGPILSQSAIQIHEDDTAGFLSDTLSKIGADLLVKTLPGYISGKITPQSQPEEGITYAPMLKKQDGWLDFNKPAKELMRRVHAFNPWPGAYMEFNQGLLKIYKSHVEDQEQPGLLPGSRFRSAKLPAIATSEGTLILDEVQLPGKKPIFGRDFLVGARNWDSSTDFHPNVQP